MKEEDTASLKTFNMNTKMISHLEEKKIITATRVQVEIFKLCFSLSRVGFQQILQSSAMNLWKQRTSYYIYQSFKTV